MFGALAFVAMRQKHGQSAEPSPFGFAGCDELIDHDLGIVSEVAELGFPNDQGFGLGTAVAVFEPEYAFLGQQRVVDVKTSLCAAEVLKWNVGITSILIVQDRVTMEKRAAPHVLASQTYAVPFRQQ